MYMQESSYRKGVVSAKKHSRATYIWQLQEGIAPLSEAFKTVALLLGVGSTGMVQPILEELFVLLENQELAEHDVRLVKALLSQLSPEDWPDPSQLCHRLLPHRLPDKVAVLLRCRHPSVAVATVGGEGDNYGIKVQIRNSS